MNNGSLRNLKQWKLVGLITRRPLVPIQPPKGGKMACFTIPVPDDQSELSSDAGKRGRLFASEDAHSSWLVNRCSSAVSFPILLKGCVVTL